jgi:hypothetical protein
LKHTLLFVGWFILGVCLFPFKLKKSDVFLHVQIVSYVSLECTRLILHEIRLNFCLGLKVCSLVVMVWFTGWSPKVSCKQKFWRKFVMRTLLNFETEVL